MKVNQSQFGVVVVLLAVIFAVLAVVVINKQVEMAKVQAIRAGATPAQLVCAFHPPETAYSRNKLCAKDKK